MNWIKDLWYHGIKDQPHYFIMGLMVGLVIGSYGAWALAAYTLQQAYMEMIMRSITP